MILRLAPHLVGDYSPLNAFPAARCAGCFMDDSRAFHTGSPKFA
ncbi:MAG: hypothetical protein U0892_10340 [Pirellulales bacterium]